MKKIDLIYEYLINRREHLHGELRQLQENVRYRDVSSVDCLELIIARERLAMFTEISHDIFHLLNIRSNKNKPP